MATTGQLRYCVTGTLKTTGPLLIGGEPSPGFDMMPFVDGLERVTIPGTSIVGVLRAEAERTVADGSAGLVDSVFGPRNGEHVSRLEIDDCIMVSGVTELRDGVAIDRRHGTAADGMKFDRTYVAPGATFRFELRYLAPPSGVDGGDQGWALVQDLVDHLMSGNVRIGRNVSNGAGSVRLYDVRWHVDDLHTRSGVLNSVRSHIDSDRALPRDDWPTDNKAPRKLSRRRGVITVTVDWTPLTPVMSAESISDGPVDLVPLHREEDTCLKLLLPGSSVKGVLRSITERITRSITEQPVPEEFSQQISASGAAWMFGTTKRRSAVHVADTYSVSIQKSGGRHAFRREVTKKPNKDGERLSELAAGLREIGIECMVPTAHVALDRWTGGAADGFLYSVLEPHGIEWEPLRISLDLDRVAGNELAAFGLLLLTIDELKRRQGPLGFGGYRGLGSIEITKVSIAGATDRLGLDGAVVNKIKESCDPIEVLIGDENVRASMSEAIHRAVSGSNDTQRDTE